jgi:hypothetical protein
MKKEIEELINNSSNQDDSGITFASADALEQEAALWKDILKGVDFYGDENLRNELKAIEAKVESEGFLRIGEEFSNTTHLESGNKQESKIFYLSKKHWAIAASFLGIVCLTWFFMSKPKQNDIVAPTQNQQNITKNDTVKTETVLTDNNTKPTTPKTKKIETTNLEKQKTDEKYTNYIAFAEENYDFKASMLYATERNFSADSEQLLMDSTLVLMQKKQYPKALYLLENHVFNPQYDAKIKAIKAHLYFSLKKYDLATSYFKTIADNPKSVYQEESEYYVLLCYLADYQQYRKSYQQLSTKISNDKEHSFYEKTLRLKRVEQ